MSKLFIVKAPPYGGKTSVKRILEGTGVTCLDMSDLIREKAGSDPEFAQFSEDLMSRREPIPSPIIHDLVEAFLVSKNPKNACFFGFPRWIEQAEWAIKNPLFSKFRVKRVVDVWVSDGELHRRFEDRKSKENRLDDTLENFEKALMDYNNNRHPIIKQFTQEPKKWKVDFISGDSRTAAKYIASGLLDMFAGNPFPRQPTEDIVHS